MISDRNVVGDRRTRAGEDDIESKTRINIGSALSRKTPEIAIVGAGLMGRWHLYFARRLGARVIAIVDPNLGAAETLAARVPGARAVTDVASLLKYRAPFAAHVCTPSRFHFDVTHTLIAAGVHVLVEKPLCQTLEEARALATQARERGVVICPVHQYAFQRGVERAIGWSNALGSIRRISFDICSAGAEGLASARRMSVIDEILPHPLSILQRLAPATRLGDVSWSIATASEGEYVAHASLDGPMTVISISLNARPTSFLTMVETDRGAITIDGFHGFATLSRGVGASRFGKITGPFARSSNMLAAAAVNLAQRMIRRETAYPGLADLIGRFYLAAVNGSPAPISLNQIIETVQAWSKLRTDGRVSGPALP